MKTTKTGKAVLAALLVLAVCESAFAEVSWIHGESLPPLGMVPGTPTTCDVIHFTTDIEEIYDNSCLGEQVQGGVPTINIDISDPLQRKIHVRFEPPAPQSCPNDFDPVCGLEGSFGPLGAGEWNLLIWYKVGISGRIRARSFHVAPIYYVDADANGAGEGSSWADAFMYLQHALAEACSYGSPAEIRVAQGIYKPSDGILAIPEVDWRAVTFQLINGVTIKGGYAGFGEPDPNARDVDAYETILSGDLNGDDGPNFVNNGDNSYHVVTGSGTDDAAVLDGFTITAGNADGPDPNNKGGGMYNYQGRPTVTNCTFRGNSADYYGGGMYNRCDVGPLITNCEFSNNCVSDHGRGGGILNDESEPTLTHCVFIDNEGGRAGGGICNYNCSGVFTDCVFVNNSVPVVLLTGGGGGAVYNGGGAPEFANCIFAGNWAGWGAAMSNVGSVPEVTNCTFAANPGAIVNWMNDCHPKLTNCILWNGGNEVLNKIGATITITYSNVQGGWPGQGNINADPLFADPNSDDYHIVGGSPCIDTGDPNYIAEPNETDLDGNPRIVNGVVDMGAYEFQGLLYVDDDAPNDPGPGDPNVSDPLEDGSEAHPFDEIQEAIDVALDGHTVLVQTGLYTGPDVWISGEIDFLGKNITVTSTDPTDWNIVNNTVIAGLVEFSGTEDANCTLTGFTIRDIAYGRIWGNHTHATISYCNISGNGPCGAIVIQDCDGTISNCLITDNTTIYLCGIFPVIRGCHGVLKNCTIASNASGIEILDGGTATIENCIIYHNSEQWTAPISVGSGGTLSISYCNLQGGLAGIGGEGDVNWGAGNIDTDPCFARLVEYLGDDYHLKSEGWRWSEQIVHGSHWLYDYVTSRCIDAGNPGSPLRDEVMTVLPDDPNNDWGINLRINMGAYGGTAEASMPPHGWALLADLNNDGIVDWLDAGLWVQHWLAADSELPADLDRNGSINGFDWALFGQDWSSETLWR